MTVNANDRIDKRSDKDAKASGKNQRFVDPTGEFPRQEYINHVSTNRAALGEIDPGLDVGGGRSGVTVDRASANSSMYPYADVRETISGHMMVFDDTPGSERVILKHKTGSGVELCQDGTVIIKTDKNQITSVGGSSTIIIEGDTNLHYGGNLKMNVVGDMNLNVGGNYTAKIGGVKSSTINGAKRELINGNSGSIVSGNRSQTVTGGITDTALGGRNNIVKGDFKNTISGDVALNSSGTIGISGADAVNMTSPDVNIAGTSLSVFGSTGTIGGEGIIMYSENSHVVNTVWAETISVTAGYGTTWHGDLTGTAGSAISANVSSGLGGGGHNVTTNSTAVNTRATALPTGALMTDYVSNATGGVMDVSVDVGDFIKNAIDRTEDNGGVSKRDLNTQETRAKLREPANAANTKFVGTQIARQKISPDYGKTSPTEIGRVANLDATPTSPISPVSHGGSLIAETFQSDKEKKTKYDINPTYDPMEFIDTEAQMDRDEYAKIGPDSVLAPGVSMATFLSGDGENANLNHISDSEEKMALARQYALHAQAYSTVLQDQGQFKSFRLAVVEGLYVEEPGETLSDDSVLATRKTGRTVVYELHDADGKISNEKTYDLATYWKDSLTFDSLVLDYDNLDVDGSLNAQIILTMPLVTDEYEIASGKAANRIKTTYNNAAQGNELIEILA